MIPFEEINEKKTILDLGVTVNKEKNYLKENDEVSDVSIWNHLLNLKKYDLFYYEQLIAQVLSGENPNFVPTGYIVYERIESAEKTRTLVSLSAKERVITTNLALRLCSILKSTWKSFSYHVSYVSCDHIFAYWYSSWGNLLNISVHLSKCLLWEIMKSFIWILKAFTIILIFFLYTERLRGY